MLKIIKNEKQKTKKMDQGLTVILRFESNKKHVSIHLMYKLKELSIITTEKHNV